MKKSKFTTALCLLLIGLFVGSAVCIPVSAAVPESEWEHKDIQSDLDLSEMESYLKAGSYSAYLASHRNVPAGNRKVYVEDLSRTVTFPDITVKKSNVRFSAADVEGDSDIVSVSADSLAGWQSIVGEGKNEDWQFYADSHKTGSSSPNRRIVLLPKDGVASWEIEVETTGMYYIGFSYYTLSADYSSGKPDKATVNNIERKLYIDGEIPFSEARYLSLSKSWAYNYETDEKGNRIFRSDLIGNSLTPEIDQNERWMSYYCNDSEGYYTEYYAFYFAEGKHTLSLEAERERCLLGDIVLIPTDDSSLAIPSYSDYLKSLPEDAKPVSSGSLRNGTGDFTFIRAEMPDYVSDSAVYMTNDRSSALTNPSVPNAQLYNVIGANSYNSIGQWAAYTFTVSQAGLHNIVMRYKQSTLEGMFICRIIKLSSSDGMYGLPDGTPTVPFKEANNARFDYNSDWQTSCIGDGENTFQFYFKEGVTYTLYLEVGLGSLASYLQRVDDSLATINDCYLRILQLTGSSPDKNRDYGFMEIMPDVIFSLNEQAVRLADIKSEFQALCGGETGQHLSTLELVSDLLARMGGNEYEIPAKLSTLKSYLGTLGTWLNSSRTSSMTVDSIYIGNVESEKDLPRANANFFQSAWFEIKAFIYSFFTEYDQMGVTSSADLSSDALSVWLASGRDQSKIWRSLVDNQFSEYCRTESEYCRQNGITSVPISLKLVTAGTLLPSILADKGPDVYMGLDGSTVINYAIRGAVVPVMDVSSYDDESKRQGFSDAAAYLGDTDAFHDASLNVIELLGKTYGVPMTMNFSMMYYRLDVLVGLESSVPETWDDLLALLPVLQANNLSAGVLGVFNTMLYQRKNDDPNSSTSKGTASMWRYEDKSIYDGVYAGAQIGLDSNAALDVFQYYCRLFTDYSFPYQYDAANRFRTGEMPIIIGDYVSIYNQLTVFATEIDGLWEFSSVPGTRADDGTLNYDSIAADTNLVIPYSKTRSQKTLAEAWEFIKWNAGEEAEAEYGNRMVALIGPSAKYAVANMKAIDKLSWTSKETRAIKDQLNHLSSVKNYPGSYIITRYVDFAFLEAKNKGTNPVEALQGYIAAINAELTRKREEFGDSGLKTLENGQTPDQAEHGKN